MRPPASLPSPLCLTGGAHTTLFPVEGGLDADGRRIEKDSNFKDSFHLRLPKNVDYWI
jgi:hypothetical protein